MAYGDDEHPISFRFAPEELGAHVHVTVWAGLDGMRGNCGTVVLRREDWAALRAILGQEHPDAERLALLRETVPADIARTPARLAGADYFTRFLLSEAGRIVHVDATPFVIGAPE